MALQCTLETYRRNGGPRDMYIVLQWKILNKRVCTGLCEIQNTYSAFTSPLFCLPLNLLYLRYFTKVALRIHEYVTSRQEYLHLFLRFRSSRSHVTLFRSVYSHNDIFTHSQCVDTCVMHTIVRLTHVVLVTFTIER